jgi:broad specificity phosphatase PhoE
MGLLLLVRHGQASFGADDYDVLSDAGHEQARTLGGWFAEQGFVPARAVHGGMRRHRETWEGIAEGLGGEAAAGIDEDWAEFDHLGVLAQYAAATGRAVDHGLDRRAFQVLFEEATGHWTAAADGYPETYDAFVGRARAALERAAAADGATVVVSSGGVIAALAATLVAPELGVDALGPLWQRFNAVMVNTSVTRVIVGSTGARLLTFNEHAHLARDQVTYR